MKRAITLFTLTLVIVLAAVIVVQAEPDSPPGVPPDDEDANACYSGGSMEGKCITDWHWKCGWFLIRFEEGLLSRENFPQECETVLPPPFVLIDSGKEKTTKDDEGMTQIEPPSL